MNGRRLKKYDLVGWDEESAPAHAGGSAGQGLIVAMNDISMMVAINDSRVMIYPDEATKIELRARPVWLNHEKIMMLNEICEAL